jgi:F0F1-type ATP synthase gamma subunit
VLEAGAGHQAATLTTMRSACDNAEETAAHLTADISHKRQSEVTSSVIETSGQNARREE